jgi:hypothetical protein
MLNPEVLTAAIVATLKTIPELVAAMGGDPDNISAHQYYFGEENSLAKTVYEMKSPSILVVWKGTRGGNFNGMTIWKHPFEIYIRTMNVAGSQSPAGPGHVWWLMMNRPVNGGSLNIRQIQIMDGVDIMDMPSILPRQDEELTDYFCASVTIPEIGDQGADD